MAEQIRFTRQNVYRLSLHVPLILLIRFSYRTECENLLYALRIDELLAADGLVAIWVTNKAKLHAFIDEHLLRHWQLVRIATWHWIKVSRSWDWMCS